MEEPMYIKIHNQIKRDIENHVYKVGDRIPAERQLSVRFGVSRMTLRQAIKTLEDLKPGMTLEGIVTNVTHFGAFVDIGVHQDGLVHISELCDRYIDDARTVVKTR